MRGLQRVGLYVPGGTAAYPSSVLMNAIPAKIAGVEELIMVTPPAANGKANPDILTAAAIAGVDRVFLMGGAQAVAALAYGTETVPKVDKIVGPGNIYVATAKKLLYGVVDIDMIAGPSEILIIADETADARYLAADLMSQAEHDVLAGAILLTNSQAHNAGSVFLGAYAPEPLGDYYAGPNHVLPTGGTARFFSPLSVDSFVKKYSFTYYTKEALEAGSEDIICIAEREGLTAHANSIKVRF